MALIFVRRITKWTLFVTATLTLILISFALHHWSREWQQSLVKIEVSYDLDACSEKTPISTLILNESSKAVINIDWWLNARIPGDSSNLIDGPGQFSSDVYIEPRKGSWFCEKAPKLKLKTNPSKIIYEVTTKHATFY